jgi:hypothetical protein
MFWSRKYIDKIQYKGMSGPKPKEYTSPLEKSDHPKVVPPEELHHARIKVYQSIIGSMQWAISLGRFDIQMESMTMSRFRTAPKKGNVERLKRMNGYLR